MQDLSKLSIQGVPCPMIFVPPGSFQLEGGKEIHFEKGFYIGQYPVTQALWKAIMGDNPARFKGDNHPIESISWDDICQENGSLAKLNALKTVQTMNLQDSLSFQLPSETMWEYAARGGSYTDDFPYAGSNKLKEVGWFNKNSYRETYPVGLKLPNQLGLYDMSGNVWEWCADYWKDSYENTPINGSPFLGNKDNTRRVVRGGSWNLNDSNCRVSTRFRFNAYDWNYDIGFRLARY